MNLHCLRRFGSITLQRGCEIADGDVTKELDLRDINKRSEEEVDTRSRERVGTVRSEGNIRGEVGFGNVEDVPDSFGHLSSFIQV